MQSHHSDDRDGCGTESVEKYTQSLIFSGRRNNPVQKERNKKRRQKDARGSKEATGQTIDEIAGESSTGQYWPWRDLIRTSAVLFFNVEALSRNTVAITNAVVAGRKPKIKSCTSGSALYF